MLNTIISIVLYYNFNGNFRFTKGLKEEDINLSTFKGEGELTSLELDENALMDVLDVPYWVRITSAKCDRVFFQVPFMAIKKVPMSLVNNLLHLPVFQHFIKLYYC